MPPALRSRIRITIEMTAHYPEDEFDHWEDEE